LPPVCRFPGQLAIGSNDPSGFAIAINASPTGMQASDPLPIDAASWMAACLSAM
jgi:hypothetical protein